MVPKIIHYCWFGKKSFPKLVQKCIATWHTYMPDYRFMLWTEDNSPMNHPYVKSAYAAKRYAFVSDYVRFWALYNYGGIYLDTDMLVLRSFDDLLNVDFFCAPEKVLKKAPQDATCVVSCGALGACALGACAKDILTMYDNLEYSEERRARLVVPRLITPVINKHPEVTIYPYDYFYPMAFEERGTKDPIQYATENTYAIHLYDFSWLNWHEKMLRKGVSIVKKFLPVVAKNNY